MPSENLSSARLTALQDDRSTPFLPMVYIAWADGDLSQDEMKAVCNAAASATDVACVDLLGAWLDPAHPPSAVELQQLLTTVRRQAKDLPTHERLSLTDLGLQIATQQDRVRGPERAALEEVERALGVAGPEAVAEILAPPASTKEGSEEALGTFNVSALAALLDRDHPEVRQELRAFLSQDTFAYTEDLPRDAYRDHVLGWCKSLAEAGYGSIAFPKEFGGEDDYAKFATAFEMLAFFDLSLLIKFGVQFGLFGGSIFQLGTQRHHEKYLAALGSLELPGCFAMTETGHGSNVRDIETTATFDPTTDEFILETPHRGARKDYIGNAARHGEMATVFAQLVVGDQEHGVHALLVPIRDSSGAAAPGVEILDCGHKMGLNGVDNGRLLFHQVRVPRDNLLDRFASVSREGHYESPIPGASARFFTMLGTLVGGRVSIALAGLSVSKSALAIAIRYALRRRQFGAPGEPEILIFDYLTHRRRLLPRLAKTYAFDFALKHLKVAFADPSQDRMEVEGLAAGLKALSTWHATDTVQICRECCGGSGYLADNRFADLKADSDIFTTFEGDNVVLLQLVAKGMLNGYRQQFQNINAMGLVRFIARQATSAVAELNPVVTHNASEEHLRSSEFHLAAFHGREQNLLASVAKRLKGRIDSGLSTQTAMIEVQDHLLSAAKAHTERIVLEKFTEGVEAVADEGVREVLEKLRQLYALSTIEADRGWFQEQGFLSAGKSKAIRTLVNHLLDELRPEALDLVEAFGIPDPLLGAEIAIG